MLHDDGQNGYGCFWLKIEFMCHTNTSWWRSFVRKPRLLVKPSAEQVCWEAGVRAEESVEQAHSTVNRLVFSRATKTIGSFAVVDDVLEKSEQVHVALLALTESESFATRS